MPELRPGQRVRILADAVVVKLAGGGGLGVQVDRPGSFLHDAAFGVGDVDVWPATYVESEWGVELEQGGYLHVQKGINSEDSEACARNIAGHVEGAVVRSRRIVVGPWELAPVELDGNGDND